MAAKKTEATRTKRSRKKAPKKTPAATPHECGHAGGGSATWNSEEAKTPAALTRVSWQRRLLRLNVSQSGELVRHGEDLDGMVRAEIR